MKLGTAPLFTLLALTGACGGTAGAPGTATAPYQNAPSSSADDAGSPGASDPADASPGAADANADAAPPRDNGAPSQVYPAPHPPFAHVVASGGPVLTAPRVVPVTFGIDPYTDALDDFAARVGGSAYWTASTAEYGVGPLTAAAPIHDPQTLPKFVGGNEVESYLRSNLAGANPPWGSPDPQAIYTLFYPPGVTIALQGMLSCEMFGAYHSEISIGGTRVVYAVVPRCPTFASLHGFDVITVAASHELVEAATDPQPFSNPAYADTDDDHAIWGEFTGGETGDLCAFNAGAFYTPPDLPYVVQRSWSNASAAASHDPCAPSLDREVYFNSAPLFDETIDLLGRKTRGITIPVGGRGTVDLALYSDGPTSGPWHVSALSLSEVSGGDPTLGFSFDRRSGVNGERIHMTIDVLGIDAEYAGEGFVVVSELNGQKSYWYGFVAN